MKYSYLIYILFFASLGCMEHEIIPLKDEFVPSCTDGILNQNEEDVDCGGVCEACYVPLASSCGGMLQDNTIIVIDDDGTGYEDKSLTNVVCGPNQAWGEYRFTGQSPSGEVEIRLNSLDLPEVEGMYSIGRGTNEDANITINYYGADWWALSGWLYIFNTPSGIVLEFCEVTFNTNFVDYYPVISGRVNCD